MFRTFTSHGLGILFFCIILFHIIWLQKLYAFRPEMSCELVRIALHVSWLQNKYKIGLMKISRLLIHHNFRIYVNAGPSVFAARVQEINKFAAP